MRSSRQFDGFFHTGRIGFALPRDVKRRAVVGTGADDRQTECEIDRTLGGHQFGGD